MSAFALRAFQGMAFAGAALLVGVAGASAAQPMKFVERAASDAVLDQGTKGDSAGDILTFANDIYDETNVTKVGTDSGWCIRIVAGKVWECTWTLTLDKGQITVEGPFMDGKDSVLAITGGTGKFKKARGEMLLHARDDKGSAYDFTYKLGK